MTTTTTTTTPSSALAPRVAGRPTHIEPLPRELMPPKSSTQLIVEHIERLKDRGVPQKVIAGELGFATGFISMLKSGYELPLPRVIAFAKAAHLSDAERHELLNARIMELHGGRGDFDVEALAMWGAELFGPDGDEGRLVGMWRDAIAPAPHLLGALLDDPAKSARVAQFLKDLVQEELRAMEAE